MPEETQDEMNGIVKGFNQSACLQCFSFFKPLSVNEFLMLQLIAEDLAPEELKQLENGQKATHKTRGISCLTIVDRDEQDRMIIAYNMDWPSLGKASENGLLIYRQRTTDFSTVEFSVPGLMGLIAGINSTGLSMTRNGINGKVDHISMPSIIFNGLCLKKNNSVQAAKRWLEEHQKELPLGPYYLTLADQQGAACFCLAQDAAPPSFSNRRVATKPSSHYS